MKPRITNALLLAISLLLAIRAAAQPVTVVAYDANGKVLHRVDGKLIRPPGPIKHQPPDLSVSWKAIQGATRIEIFVAGAELTDGARIPIPLTNVRFEYGSDVATISGTVPGGTHYPACGEVTAAPTGPGISHCLLRNSPPPARPGMVPR